MMEKKFVIKNQNGLHARPATIFVQKANTFKCELILSYLGTDVNLKSIMGVLSLGVMPNSEITIKAEGIDEKEAISALSILLDEINKKA